MDRAQRPALMWWAWVLSVFGIYVAADAGWVLGWWAAKRDDPAGWRWSWWLLVPGGGFDRSRIRF